MDKKTALPPSPYWANELYHTEEEGATPTKSLSVSFLRGWSNLRLGRCPA